jgi:4-amino-4-deoxy-L-arabinose transferase-like glycosyltransferase
MPPNSPTARIILLLLAAAALYLIGNDRVGLFDRDEPRYAQTSRQMLNSNPPDWIVPRLLDQVRTAKPVLIYWCQAASMKFLGQTPFAARLPSALAMLLTLSILAIVLTKTLDPQLALWTLTILASSGLVIAAAKMCITDSVLLLWITIAQLCLYAIYNGNSSWLITILLWLAVGLAGLTKGPVVLAVQFSTLLVLSALDVGHNWRSPRAWLSTLRWLKRTRPLVGLFIVLAIVTPWLWAIEQRSPGFLRQTLLHDVWTRAIKPLEGHKGPPGFYLLTVWGTFFPWSLLLPTVATLAWKNRAASTVRFALAAVIGPWVVMEFVQTKLVHYVLPAFVPLAFLTADALLRCIRHQHDDLHRPLFVRVAAIWAILVALAASTPWLLARPFWPVSPTLLWTMVALSLLGILYAATVFLAFHARRIAAAASLMAAGMAAVLLLIYGLWLPHADFMWLPQRIANLLIHEGATRQGDVFMVDFKEDSLAFYQGGTIRPKDNDYLTRQSPDQWGTFLVLTQNVLQQMPPENLARLQILHRLRGWAYADRGRIVEVLIARKSDDPKK